MMKFYPPPHVHWNPNCLMVKPTPSASQPRLDAFLRIFHLRATAYGNLSQLWHSSWHMVHQNCDVPWATTSDTSAGWWFQPLWKIWVRQLGWLFPIYIYIWKHKTCSKPPTRMLVNGWLFIVFTFCSHTPSLFLIYSWAWNRITGRTVAGDSSPGWGI